jgi:Fur family ferric uptake transcriptional regulator
MLDGFRKQAEEMILNRADRVTPGRILVLAMLLEEQQALSHHELEQRLQGKHRLDRVTLYRVLEWLNDRGYVHRVVDEDRVWRFRANLDIGPHQHAHFECTRCTRVICLDDLKAEYNRALPAGYRPEQVELTVKGLCAECA